MGKSFEFEKVSPDDLPNKKKMYAEGRGKEKDIRKIMRHICVRFQDIDDSNNRVAGIYRFDKKLMGLKVNKAVTRTQIMEKVKNLSLDGIKEAIENTYNINIPQKYLDEVGYQAN